MSLGTANRDGGKTSESGHLRAVAKANTGFVLNGLNAVQRAAGVNMSVDVQAGDAFLRRSDNSYSHPVFNDAVYNQVISAADGANPRRDIVVMYVDYAQAPSTAVSNNTNGVVKIKVVNGTPAGSPVDPTDAAIQSSVGAGNPYIKLARVRVGAGVTSLANAVIDDLRVIATGNQAGGWIYEDINAWIYASASSFTVNGVDVTAQFPVGTKIAVWQAGTVKYFVVIASSFSTNTTVTLDGFSLYTLTNVPIDRPAYSYSEQPTGMPIGNTLIPYKFSAYRNAAMSVSGGFAAIPLDAEEYDTSNNFNTANGRFTVPVAGYYIFTGYVGYASDPSGTHHLTTFYKNGVEVKRGGEWAFANAANHGLCATCLIKLSPGDYIELAGYSGPSVAIQPGSPSLTQMAGYLLTRA